MSLVGVEREEMIRRVDALLDAAKEAGRDYDWLVFGAEELKYRKDGHSGTLGANLTFLEEQLDELAKDLRS